MPRQVPPSLAAVAPRGYTLIELVVAMAALAILTAIAVPTYGDYVNRARRSEGRQALTETLQQMERYYAANNRFTDFSNATTNGFRTYSGDNSGASHYVLSAAACAGFAASACVVISAVPSGSALPPSGSRFVDPQCGTLTLSTNGARGPASCW